MLTGKFAAAAGFGFRFNFYLKNTSAFNRKGLKSKIKARHRRKFYNQQVFLERNSYSKLIGKLQRQI